MLHTVQCSGASARLSRSRPGREADALQDKSLIIGVPRLVSERPPPKSQRYYPNFASQTGVFLDFSTIPSTTTVAVLGELRRNDGPRRLIGIESEAGMANPWNISRFEDVLG